MSIVLQHFDELDGEDEGGVGRDVGAGAALAVGEVVGDVELVDGAFFHELHAFRPSGDDLLQAEFGGLVAAVAGVEDRSVDERPLVVAAYRVAGFGLAARALFDDLVLQAAGGDGDAGLAGVGLQECLAVGFRRLAALGGLGLLAFLQLVEEVFQHRVGFRVAHHGLAPFEHIAYGGGVVVDIQALLEPHSDKLVGNVVAQCIAKFIHNDPITELSIKYCNGKRFCHLSCFAYLCSTKTNRDTTTKHNKIEINNRIGIVWKHMANKIIVQDTPITVIKQGAEDYICLTDMLQAKDGDFFVTDWLRNRNTLEYIGIWEKVYNPDFNYGEFATIRSQAGLNRFKISVKEFVARTNAISLQAKAGRYGGTYAHKDIAFEFAMWISPEFKIFIVKEFQRLKEEEQKAIGWNAKRELSKINYHIHTDAVRANLVPDEVDAYHSSLIYAEEADVLNVALFGITAKEWRDANPDKKGNMRDYATINQLICLSNLENINAVFISDGIAQRERLKRLNQIAIKQMSVLEEVDNRKLLK